MDPTQTEACSAVTAGIRCRLCGLIFDVEPIELGRAESDDTICIVCEQSDNYQMSLW